MELVSVSRMAWTENKKYISNNEAIDNECILMSHRGIIQTTIISQGGIAIVHHEVMKIGYALQRQGRDSADWIGWVLQLV